jgi:hypothetical protein
MSISPPTIQLPPTPRALFDIVRLEAGPSALPASKTSLIVSLAAYGVGEAAYQSLGAGVAPSIVYGLLCIALLYLLAFVVHYVVGKRELFQQTLTALAATSAMVLFLAVALSFLTAQVFPPPLPTGKLVGFLLFPLVLWRATLVMWMFRHASLRFIPALAIAACYVGFTGYILAPLLARIFERL